MWSWRVVCLFSDCNALSPLAGRYLYQQAVVHKLDVLRFCSFSFFTSSWCTSSNHLPVQTLQINDWPSPLGPAFATQLIFHARCCRLPGSRAASHLSAWETRLSPPSLLPFIDPDLNPSCLPPLLTPLFLNVPTPHLHPTHPPTHRNTSPPALTYNFLHLHFEIHFAHTSLPVCTWRPSSHLSWPATSFSRYWRGVETGGRGESFRKLIPSNVIT